MSNDWLEKVRDFHNRFATPPDTEWQNMAERIGCPERDALEVAARECEETARKCREESIASDSIPLLRMRLNAEEQGELAIGIVNGDKVEVVDAICDLLYVTLGAAVHLGVDRYIDAAFAEIHRSNMTKVPLPSDRKTDGKVEKGENYEPPDLGRVMDMVDAKTLGERK